MKTREIDVWISYRTKQGLCGAREFYFAETNSAPIKAKLIIPVEPEVVEFVEDCSYGKIISDNFKKLQGKRWKIRAEEVIE